MKQTLFIRQLATYFENHLPDARRCSPNTIASYADTFALLFQFLQDRKGIPHHRVDYKNFTPSTMDDFVLWMRSEHNYSSASVKQRLSAINSFMKYASRREMAALPAYTSVMGTEKPKGARMPFPYFTLDEIRILLHLPNTVKKTEKRDLVLLSLLYESAARAQEICNLKVGDIRFGQPTRIKLLGKGDKLREIPISEDVTSLLRYHLKVSESEKQRGKPLFTSQLGGEMTTACIRNLVNKYVTRAKQAHPDLFHEPRYSPHSFRHSKAVHMAESGTPLIYIRNFLGHESTQSTEIYARIGQSAIVKMLTERGNDVSKSAERAGISLSNEPKSSYPKFLDAARGK